MPSVRTATRGLARRRATRVGLPERRPSGKALGCGVRFTWKEIEIVGRPKPGVRLSGRTAAYAERVQAGPIDLSMTHSREIAAAIAVVSPRVDG